MERTTVARINITIETINIGRLIRSSLLARLTNSTYTETAKRNVKNPMSLLDEYFSI